MERKEYYNVFYGSESINADFLIKWVDSHKMDFMDSDDGLSVSQIATLVCALENYRQECEQHVKR